jgi:serine/threonine-protein kinase RsbW
MGGVTWKSRLLTVQGGNTYRYVEPRPGGWSMSIWWSLHLRREAASVPLARRLLLGTMETAGVDPDVSYDLSVALSSEAYRVTAYLDGEKCRIEVADSGPGFTVECPAPTHAHADADAEAGRGLYLIRELADHVHIGNKPGLGGAVVSFDKVLKWRADAPLMAV